MFEKIKENTSKEEFNFLAKEFSQKILKLVEKEIIELDLDGHIDPIGIAFGYRKEIAINEIVNKRLKELLEKQVRIASNGRNTEYLLLNTDDNNELYSLINIEKYENSHILSSDTMYFLDIIRKLTH